MPPNTWIAVSPTDGQLAGECLGAQRSQVAFRGFGRIGSPQRVDDAAAREFDRLVHVDAQMLDGLEAADRLVELLFAPSRIRWRGSSPRWPRRARRRRRRSPHRRRVALIASVRRRREALRGHIVEFDIGQLARRVDVGARRHGHAGRCRVDGVQPGAVALRRRTPARRRPRRRRAPPVTAPRSVAPSVAAGRGPVSGADRGDGGTLGDSGQQSGRISCAACVRAPAPRRRRSTTTDPGRARRPSSSATTPASTIVMPAPS